MKDIIDSIFHESIHSTAREMERWNTLPDEQLHPVEYMAEELVAHVGVLKLAILHGCKEPL